MASKQKWVMVVAAVLLALRALVAEQPTSRPATGMQATKSVMPAQSRPASQPSATQAANETRLKSGKKWPTATHATLTVQGTANIYGAGHQSAPSPAGGGGGTLPPSHSFGAASGTEVLVFTKVDGQVVGDRNRFAPNGPDGFKGSTDTFSFNGISGIKSNHSSMFLTGVFLGDKEPTDPAPVIMDCSASASSNEFFPSLGQTFFIGDGLTDTGSGEAQKFHVPEGAKRLFLGFSDGWATKGLPGFYDDNAGSLTVKFRIGRDLTSRKVIPTTSRR